MQDNEPDESFGSEVRRLSSPQFAARQRRRSLIGSFILLVMGICVLVAGVQGMLTGELVKIGGKRNGFYAPWWMSVALGVVIVFLSIWTAWPDSKRRS